MNAMDMHPMWSKQKAFVTWVNTPTPGAGLVSLVPATNLMCPVPIN